MKNWFEVSTKGLKELQLGKPKYYAVRELIQNAFDEDITVCEVNTGYDKPYASIRVYDDYAEGFRDIKDAYTLFKETYKRNDPAKRGRFNLGEKQAIAICEKAVISTTKGTVVFNKEGRHESRKKTEKGSEVELVIKMTDSEYNEMLNHISSYLVPKDIKFIVNGKVVEYKEPFKVFETHLRTEKQENGAFVQTIRKTKICLHNEETAMLYEMGIPVTKIDCKYSVDIQQKVPLGKDRETVTLSYLKDLYAEILNNASDDIKPEDSSANWVHAGMSDERIEETAVKDIVKARYGEKVCFNNPFDRVSNDDAIASGYKVIGNYEVSAEERENIKKYGIIESSTALFGCDAAGYEIVNPDKNQLKVAEYTKRIAKKVLGIDVEVVFAKSNATALAAYQSGKVIFNVTKLPKNFFDKTVCWQTTSLVLHELGHSEGMHTEKTYHQCLTDMAGKLIDIALKDPLFFNFDKD